MHKSIVLKFLKMLIFFNLNFFQTGQGTGSPVVEGVPPTYPEITSATVTGLSDGQTQLVQSVIDKNSLAMNGPMTVGPTHLYPTVNTDMTQPETLAVTPARLASGHTIHFFTPLGPDTAASYALLNQAASGLPGQEDVVGTTNQSSNDPAIKVEPRKSRFQVTKVMEDDQCKGK